MADRSLSFSLPRTWPSRQRQPFRLHSEPRPAGRGPLGLAQRAALGWRKAPLGVAQRAALGGRRASLEGTQVLLGVAQRAARAALAGRRASLGGIQVLLGVAQRARRGVVQKKQAIRPYTRARAMTGKVPTCSNPRSHQGSCDLTGKANDDKDKFCRFGVFHPRQGTTLRDCGASYSPIRTCQCLCILAESVPVRLYVGRLATRTRCTHHSRDRGPHTKVLVAAWW